MGQPAFQPSPCFPRPPFASQYASSIAVNPQTLWTYHRLHLQQPKPRPQQVARATRQLVICRTFILHVVNLDKRIHPVLVADTILHEAYLFIVKTIVSTERASGSLSRPAIK